MIDLRVRSRISDTALEPIVGQALSEGDLDVLLTGPAYVRKPDGKPLCVYLPGAVAEQVQADGVYTILNSLKAQVTMNRGNAGGTRRLEVSKGQATRTYTKPLASSIIGSIDPVGQMRYCRLTAWTGRNLPQWEQLQPLLRAINGHLRAVVPDRHAVQQARADASDPAWIIPGTAFSTVTVNNTYPTGVHKDKGDLAEGFSTIACLRRGTYTGGLLTFPAYRVGVDLADGDLILMDAHEYHGNTRMHCACGTRPIGPCRTCNAERISVVSYYREALAACGTAQQEADRAQAHADRRAALTALPQPTGDTP